MAKGIAELEANIAEMHVQLKRASEDRELENKIFQQTVADQQATAALLTKALNVLKGFYDKKALLLQKNAKKQPAGPPPPPGFKAGGEGLRLHHARGPGGASPALMCGPGSMVGLGSGSAPSVVGAACAVRVGGR